MYNIVLHNYREALITLSVQLKNDPARGLERQPRAGMPQAFFF